MPTDELTGRERAILRILMAEARSLTNNELQAAAGLRLDGASRRRLNERRLAESPKAGRSLAGPACKLTDGLKVHGTEKIYVVETDLRCGRARRRPGIGPGSRVACRCVWICSAALKCT